MTYPSAPAGSREREPERERPRRAGPLESSFTIAKVRGIPIGAHWSWLFVFALVVWTLAAQLFPRTYPGLDDTTYAIMAAVAAVVFFASILLHELGHAVHALHQGMRIDGITLWLFGGVARFSTRFPSPTAEFRIAAAGPLVSLVLAVGFGGLAWAGSGLGWPDSVRGVVDYLARINVLVLGFNLVPAMPLDGGRMLRAWLWKRQESFEAATVSASRVGKLFGVALIVVGVLGVFGDASTGGIWIALIGWFVYQAAQAEAMQTQMLSLLSGLRVSDVMTPDPDTAQPSETIEHLLDRAATAGGHSTYPVVRDGRLVGMVSIRAAGRVARDERAYTPVERVMTSSVQTPRVRARDDLADAIDVLQEHGRAVVVDADTPVGVVSGSDLRKAVRMHDLREAPKPAPVRGTGVLVWIVVALAIGAAIGWLYHPPVVAVAPGATIDLSDDVRISGVQTESTTGEYRLTSVTISRPNGWGALVAWLHPDRELASVGSVVPRGVDTDRYLESQRDLFLESRTLAAAAAARAAGLDVTIEGDGAEVVGVIPDTPADGEIREGDVIVSINGREVRVAAEVIEAVRSRPAGERFDIGVLRDGERRTVSLRSRAMERVLEGAPALGVAVRTRDLNVALPFSIQFRDRAVAGPSAGAAYALVIADKLGLGDLAQGRTIVASGTIDVQGSIGAVGGLEQKTVAAEQAGADVFIVPRVEGDRLSSDSVTIRPVGSLEEAIGALRTQP